VNEDQRIYYVALSRAKKRIFITSHTKMITKTGQEYRKDLSPFNRSIEKSFIKTDV
jgi:DNA helicase-2/ATP-dependent DNA helicase PcrA